MFGLGAEYTYIVHAHSYTVLRTHETGTVCRNEKLHAEKMYGTEFASNSTATSNRIYAFCINAYSPSFDSDNNKFHGTKTYVAPMHVPSHTKRTSDGTGGAGRTSEIVIR